MDWNEILINIPAEYCERTAAIANMVVAHGIYIEDYSDLEEGAMEIAHIDLIDEELLLRDRNLVIIHIYISREDNAVEAAAFLKERLTAENIPFTVESGNVSDEEWNDNWKKFFKVTEIGEKLVIRPSWEEYKNTSGKKVLSIDPGAAFGTGTHATTKMCLALLERYVDEKSKILDIGCGSGILSIAGLLLGAESATGVDIDKTAVKVSNENAGINNVQNKAEFFHGNLCDKIIGKYNVICANIVADVIMMLLDDIENYMAEDALFLCSGIIDIRADEVKNSFKSHDYKIIDIMQEDNWFAFAAKKN
ncbi:MAG: 50S ribosomal protein L11 methyltransferase [Oscillospiraceae bacterium]